MRPPLAQEYVGGREIFDAMKSKDLIRPKIERKRLVLFDKVLLDLACDKFSEKDLPSRAGNGSEK
jgi:hypothetical protein